MLDKKVIIYVVKYGDIPHYSWSSRIVDLKQDYIVVASKPGRTLQHFTRKTEFTFDSWAIEFFFFKQWFTVAAVVDDFEELSIDQYYCNIAQPAKYDGARIKFVDLDLDLIKKQDDPWQVVDRDDFQRNQKKYNYPKKLIKKTECELKKLKNRINNNDFPFEGTIKKYIKFVGQHLVKK